MTITAAERAMDARRPRSSSPGLRRPAPIRREIALPAGLDDREKRRTCGRNLLSAPAWS
jgi:hypothetical protein